MRWSIFILTLVITLSCNNSDSVQNDIEQDAETIQMVNELKAIPNSGNVLEMWHQNETRAKHFENLAEQTPDQAQKFSLVFKAAIEWLNAGQYDKSIDLFSSVIEKHERGEVSLNAKSIKQFYELLAVSYLRKGEIENCVHHHDKHSCIMPIQKSAIHGKREGSASALKIYEILLQQDPGDLQNIWLYNLAHMTLGQYPEAVNKAMLIPESVFTSDHNMKPFEDVAMKAGVAVNDISGSCVVEDFNNDGLLDILASSYGLTDQLRLFMNKGNGKFSDKTAASGLKGITSGLNMVQADYDNDGFVDVLVLRGAWLAGAGTHPNSLLRNNGDGSFSDVTRSAGLYSLHPTQTACWGDFNNDGWIDLFIGNESSPNSSHKSELYINQGNGQFVESALSYGLDINLFVKGTACADIDNDGDLDLLISNVLGPNRLYQNQGEEGNYRFIDISTQAGIANPNFSFPCWFWDVNNDGLTDIFINSFDIRDFTTASGKVAADYLGIEMDKAISSLYINNGQNSFMDKTVEFGLDKVLYTMGCNFADIDNDGYLDFYAATGTPDFRAVFPNRMFRNDSGKGFQDVTTATGTGHIQKGHGVGFGDFDNDGDQDMYTVLGGSYTGDNFMNALFRNPNEEANGWLKLKLEGTESNRSAIGSRLHLRLRMRDGSTKDIYRTVGSGASFGCNSLRQEIGLGDVEEIEQLVITWQGSGLVQQFDKLNFKSFYKIKEGVPQPELMTLTSFKF